MSVINNLKKLFAITTINFIFITSCSNAIASPYQISKDKELLYLGVGGALNLIGYATYQDKSGLSIDELQSLDDHDIPSIDRGYAGTWNTDARNRSDVILGVSLAFPATLLASNRSEPLTIGIMYAETFLTTLGGVTLTKGLVDRNRPFTYGDKAPLEERTAKDARRSFFSGHSAHITASLVFTAKVYSDYHPGSPYLIPIWSATILASAYGSWQRVEAGWHFPTDVLVGMLWGGITGYAIPHLHKTSSNTSIIPFASSDNIGVLLQRRF